MMAQANSKQQAASRKARRFVDLVDGASGPRMCVTGVLVLPDDAQVDTDLAWTFRDEAGQDWLIEDVIGNLC